MTFHLEAVNGPDEAVDLVQAIGVAGMEAGVAIKPGTKVDLLLEVMRMCKTKDTQGKPSKNGKMQNNFPDYDKFSVYLWFLHFKLVCMV